MEDITSNHQTIICFQVYVSKMINTGGQGDPTTIILRGGAKRIDYEVSAPTPPNFFNYEVNDSEREDN